MNTEFVSQSDNDAVLMQSLFIHLARVITEYDGHAMRRLQLRRDQAQRLSTMTTADLIELGTLGGHCIDIRINQTALDEVLRLIDRHRGQRDLINRCLLKDAPRSMMSYFFGLTGKRYTRFRQALCVPVRCGRHAGADEKANEQIFRLYTERGRSFTPETLLYIAEHLDLPLRTVWDAVNNLHKDQKASNSPAPGITRFPQPA